MREQGEHFSGHDIQKSVIDWYNLFIGMQGQGQGYVNISKKAIIVQEKQANKQMGKKNKREEWQDVRQFQKIQRNIPKKRTESAVKDILQEQKDRRLIELCEILPHHSPSDILKSLKKHRYDMTETITHMTEEPQKPEQKPEKKMDNTEMAHTLLSQVCDQFEKENISGQQFQQIFEEIAEMFRKKDRQAQEVNSFEDQCSSLKAALLIAFQEELANYDDFQFDLESPLWRQTEDFKLQANEQRFKASKDIDEDFPALSSNVKEESAFYKTLKQEKKKQQQLIFFTPPKQNLPQFSQKKLNTASIFNLDNKVQTETALANLHKKFGNIPIPWLKFVYRQLDGNINQCCEFFWKYYKQMCEGKVIPVRKAVASQPQQVSRPRVMSNVASMARKEEVNEDVRHLTLREIRDELDHLYKLRQTIQIMKGKVKSGNQRQQLQRMITQKNPRIAKLARAARIRQLQRMSQGDPLYIDLHGYRQQQIPPLFDHIAQMLRENKWSDKVKARKVNGRLTATFIAMTGKGIHSWGHRSVLKPALQTWCARNDCQSFEQSDHLRLSIPLQ